MSVSFLEAGKAEMPAVLSFMSKLYAEDGYAFDAGQARRALEALVGDDAFGGAWLICDEGRAVGYVALTLGYSLEYQGRDGFVDELFVDAAHRTRGLGARALAFLEDHCRSLGIRALHVEVQAGNERAFGLYRRCGFEDQRRRLLTKRLA